MMLQKNFMIQADIETLYKEKIVEKMTSKTLFNLFSRGNMNAYDIYTGKNNGQITIEDLSQELYLFLMEHENDWYLHRSPSRFSTDEHIVKIVFLSEDVKKEFFRVVSNTLYREKTRHENRKLWIELDREEVKIDDISAIASHTCIDDVMTLSMYNSFCSYLFSVKPKKAQRYIDCINLRLSGLKYSEIAEKLNMKETTVKDSFSQLKTLWKEFNK